MPRPKKAGDEGREVKKRSRNGCWPCKARKVKCGEEKPCCTNCQRQGETCDYSIRLNWDGRSRKKDGTTSAAGHGNSFQSLPSTPSQTALLRNTSNHCQQPELAIPKFGMAVASTMSSSAQPLSVTSFSELAPQNLGPSQPAPPIPLLRNPTWDVSSNLTSVLGSSTRPANTRHTASYPTPADSSFVHSSYNPSPFQFAASTFSMPPPMPASTTITSHDAVASPYSGAKRLRMSPRSDAARYAHNGHYRSSSSLSYAPDHSSYYNPATPSIWPSYLRDPLTPSASTAGNGGNDTDDRRISVSSLLSEDLDEPSSRKTSNTSNPSGYDGTLPKMQESRRGSLHQTMISYSETEIYGYDSGQPDWDIGRNNDATAISGAATPSEHSDFESWLNDTDFGTLEFGFKLDTREQAFNPGGYYAQRVPIRIPKKFEPLPTILVENPMNLLYFHHFLNHTAKILVPHDCPENPFKTILPQMAVKNPNLLNLMLAYSACHRARLLGHREPTGRIAEWVRDVFPSLRATLAETNDPQISNANLATAIMLASLEIISPSSFGVHIPWQHHLSLARSIIQARGGPQSISRKDPVMYFLSRWLAYLDVLGSLSNRICEDPLFEGSYWHSSHDTASTKASSSHDEDLDDDDDYTIDCLLGFTTRCIYILAQIASLARQCAPYRLDGKTGKVNVDWRPPPDILLKADKLREDLDKARRHEQRQCTHHSPVMTKATLTYAPPPAAADHRSKEAEESLACNDAYHWAGLVHLLRRVYNIPRGDPSVQQSVEEIMKQLAMLRMLGSAEACSLFPMFTAGVETDNALHQAEIIQRLRGAEALGMCQVSRARKIMEECRNTGANWESIVNGDFFG